MKKLVISTTLIAAILGSGAILAAQSEHNHAQTQKPGATAGCPMKGESGQHAQNARGNERMAQMHARTGERMAQHGEHAGHGKAGENCPMHEQKKTS